MNTEKLFKTFNELSPLTKEAWADFSLLFAPLELTRNEYLVREGSRVSHCYVLTEGAVRTYYNKNGNEDQTDEINPCNLLGQPREKVVDNTAHHFNS